MQGERCDMLHVGPHGIDGDRRFAFESADAPIGKPLLRSTERFAMLRSQAVHTDTGGVAVRVPSGVLFGTGTADLAGKLGLEPASSSSLRLRLLERNRPFTDVRPIALHSLATEHALSSELGNFDARRLRSNIILSLDQNEAFAEDALSGSMLQLGSHVQLRMLERIPRCRMVALHPETAVEDRTILRWLAQYRQGRAGIYARTLTPGTITVGDIVSLID